MIATAPAEHGGGLFRAAGTFTLLFLAGGVVVVLPLALAHLGVLDTLLAVLGCEPYAIAVVCTYGFMEHIGGLVGAWVVLAAIFGVPAVALVGIGMVGLWIGWVGHKLVLFVRDRP